MSKNILIIAAHPDDELLGIGGTVIKHVEDGDKVFALILGEGAVSRDGSSIKDIKRLHQQTYAASKVVGFKEVFFCDFPDNSFDTVSLLAITKKVEFYLNKIAPQIVYTHFQNDLNIDHRRTFEAVLTACRPCNEKSPDELYTFETLSSTEWQTKNVLQFQPNSYVNIENFIDKKIKALGKYAVEMKKYPHSRSEEGIRILAQYRGLESGFKFAEAFCLIRRMSK